MSIAPLSCEALRPADCTQTAPVVEAPSLRTAALPPARHEPQSRAPTLVPPRARRRTSLENLQRTSRNVVAGDDAWGNIKAQLARIKALDRGPRQHIVILGGGIAGLTAAYELKKLGHSVEVIEGSGRLGGRIMTHRFADGTYHELGAMRIPKSHDYTRHYVRELGLTLRPFVTSHANTQGLYDIRDTKTRIADAKRVLYPRYELRSSEKAARLAPDLAGKHLTRLLHSLTAQERASLFSTKLAPRLREFDHMTVRRFLERHASKEAIELASVADGTEPFLNHSVTSALREEMREVGTGLEEIEGGMDQLPRRLAARLAGRIEVNTKVLGIHVRPDGKIDLDLRRPDGSRSRETATRVLSTLPFAVLRQLDVSPKWSPKKMAAIREMDYDSATKVLLHTKRRFWEQDDGIVGGASHSDGIGRATYYPSDHVGQTPKDGPGVLVGSYNWGQDARRLGVLPKKEREAVIIREVSRLHPQLAEPGMVDDSASIFWDEYPWAAGAFASSGLGEHDLYGYAIKPEGNISFAGEHCSLDQGWIQGALISALRAVEEIVTSR